MDRGYCVNRLLDLALKKIIDSSKRKDCGTAMHDTESGSCQESAVSQLKKIEFNIIVLDYVEVPIQSLYVSGGGREFEVCCLVRLTTELSREAESRLCIWYRTSQNTHSMHQHSFCH